MRAPTRGVVYDFVLAFLILLIDRPITQFKNHVQSLLPIFIPPFNGCGDVW
jgi:hypothetical protein